MFIKTVDRGVVQYFIGFVSLFNPYMTMNQTVPIS